MGRINDALVRSREIEQTVARGGDYLLAMLHPVPLVITDEQGRTVPSLEIVVNDPLALPGKTDMAYVNRLEPTRIEVRLRVISDSRLR